MTYRNDLGLRRYKASIDEGEPMANSTDLLENQEFYELMQQYRITAYDKIHATSAACDDCGKVRPLREYEKDNLAGTAVLHIEICEECYKERTE